MNYLIYVERSAENLQFFLWYRDYAKRFGAAKNSDMALATEWTQAMEDEAANKIQKENQERLRQDPAAARIFKGTDFEKQTVDATVTESKAAFGTPPTTPGGDDSTLADSHASNYRSQANEAFDQAGIKQPCRHTPFLPTEPQPPKTKL